MGRGSGRDAVNDTGYEQLWGTPKQLLERAVDSSSRSLQCSSLERACSCTCRCTRGRETVVTMRVRRRSRSFRLRPDAGWEQGFLALGVNEWSLPGHRSSGRMTDAVGRRSSFSLSSYGFVGVPARNADLAGLRLRIREIELGVLG